MTLEAAIRQFNRKVERVSEQEFRARCIALANATIRNTPVDTGRLRANWQATLDQPAAGTVAAVGAEGGMSAQMRAAQTAAGLKVDQSFYLTNNLDYAVPVEEGTDRMPPRRMLARAIQQAASKF